MNLIHIFSILYEILDNLSGHVAQLIFDCCKMKIFNNIIAFMSTVLLPCLAGTMQVRYIVAKAIFYKKKKKCKKKPLY